MNFTVIRTFTICDGVTQPEICLPMFDAVTFAKGTEINVSYNRRNWYVNGKKTCSRVLGFIDCDFYTQDEIIDMFFSDMFPTPDGHYVEIDGCSPIGWPNWAQIYGIV